MRIWVCELGVGFVSWGLGLGGAGWCVECVGRMGLIWDGWGWSGMDGAGLGWMGLI